MSDAYVRVRMMGSHGKWDLTVRVPSVEDRTAILEECRKAIPGVKSAYLENRWFWGLSCIYSASPEETR